MAREGGCHARESDHHIHQLMHFLSVWKSEAGGSLRGARHSRLLTSVMQLHDIRVWYTPIMTVVARLDTLRLVLTECGICHDVLKLTGLSL